MRLPRVSLLLSLFGLYAFCQETPLALAHLMVARVEPVSNAYVHRPLVWRLPDYGPACFRGDCSGMLIMLWRASYGFDGAWFRREFGVERPLARHLFEAVAPGKALIPVERVADLRAGDWLFTKYDLTNARQNTGHVMMVASNYESRFIEEPSAPLVPGTAQVRCPIIDSTLGHHGRGDTREGHGTNGGIGLGFLRLYVKDDGRPAGYASSFSPRSIFYASEKIPFRMARFTGPEGERR